MRNLIIIMVLLYIAIPCMAEPNCTAEIPGDLDNNCKVDFIDFSMMCADWQQSTTCEPNVTEEWVARYNGPGNDKDRVSDIAADSSGNIYITGGSAGPGTSYDYATVKYDPDGNQLWVARYDGPESEIDFANAIAVDNSCNVYVAGRSWSSGSANDYVTVKYDPNGNQMWVAKFDGPENGQDYATAVTIDDSGNTYVTGSSYRNVTANDYATIKYDSNGNQLWVAIYSGPANDDDNPTDIVIDSIGNIYVTGDSEGPGTWRDYATVKYDPNGNELWVARYDGPTHHHDDARAITIDTSNNIYVTGRSASSTYDYGTIKYDPNGNELWVARYNGPGNYNSAHAITVDSSGNAYVTGNSTGAGTEDDYATVKYDSNGNQKWVARYDGPASSYDYASDITVGSSGSIYVTGLSKGNDGDSDYDFATVKYSNQGNELWVSRWDRSDSYFEYFAQPSMVISGSDDVYITGEDWGSGTYDDYTTVKYNSSGTQLWVAYYDGTATNDDQAFAIAIDDSGNIHVSGASWGANTYEDYLTVKYDSDGNELWTARYNGPDDDDDSAEAMTVDTNGNIYVTGTSKSSSTSDDYATVKYDANGNEIWVARYDGPANSYDSAHAIDIDTFGNVYVTGGSCGIGTEYDYATIKYDPNGNELWVARYAGPTAYGDSAQAITIDMLGNVYVTGSIYDSSKKSDFATIKYDANGNQLWIAKYNGPGNRYDQAHAIALDFFGNIYITGHSDGSGSGYDYATIKYDPNGNELWVVRYDGPDNSSYSWDWPNDLEIDSAGNIYVTGYSYNGTDFDYATIKYDVYGNELWLARYDRVTSDYDQAQAIAIDNLGNAYVTGYSGYYHPDTEYDYATVKYDPNGHEIWIAMYDGPSSHRDMAQAIAIDSVGNVYVTGYSSDAGYYDYTTIKYSSACDCIPPLQGDIVSDCVVDFADLAILALHWLKCNLDPPEACWN